jgi:hypothetical protein
MRKVLLASFLFLMSGACFADSLFFTGTFPTLGDGVTNSGSNPIFNCCGIDFTAAVGFSVPTGTSYQLDDMLVMLVSDGNSASSLSALLYLDSSGNPGGSSVADLSTTICPCDNGTDYVYTLTPSTSYVLTPDTTYWLVLNAVPASNHNIGWVGTNDANPYSGIFSYAGSRSGNGGLPTEDIAPRKLFFAVDGTAIEDEDMGSGLSEVPEPRALSAMLIGLFLLVGGLRRVRNGAAA